MNEVEQEHIAILSLEKYSIKIVKMIKEKYGKNGLELYHKYRSQDVNK
jgi:hypothetical protein